MKFGHLEGEQPQFVDLLTMVATYELFGMILQVHAAHMPIFALKTVPVGPLARRLVQQHLIFIASAASAMKTRNRSFGANDHPPWGTLRIPFGKIGGTLGKIRWINIRHN